MPQQFVRGGEQDPNYGQLLAQTQQQAVRQDERQKRKAAQAALLQQMVDRGEIKVKETGDIKMGREGMTFANPEARQRYQESLRPESVNLTRENENSSTQEVMDTGEDIQAKAMQSAIAAHMAADPTIGDKIATERVLLQTQREQFANNESRTSPTAEHALNDPADGVVQGGGIGTGKPDPGNVAERSAKAARDGAEIANSLAEGVNSEGGAESGGGQGRSASGRASHNERVAESRGMKDQITIDNETLKASAEASDRIKTTTTKGMNFYDEIRESLPSLRRAAAIESISAMFGGRDQKAPGQFDQLANQRERDLATYNQRLQEAGTNTTITGGLKKTSMTGGRFKSQTADAMSGSTTIVQGDTNVTTGNVTNKSGGSKEKGLGTFQGPGGASVEAVVIDGVVKSTKGAIAVSSMGDDIKDPGAVITNIKKNVASSWNSLNKDEPVEIGESTVSGDGKLAVREVKMKGKHIGNFEWQDGRGIVFLKKRGGPDVPVELMSALTGNEFNTDDVNRTELGEAERIGRGGR